MAISTVYTTRFLGEQGVTGALEYTVPVGFVAVPTHADVFAASSIPGAMHLKSFTGNWTFGYWVVGDTEGHDVELGVWDGRVAFVEGETFGFNGDGIVAFDVQITGFLLSLAA